MRFSAKFPLLEEQFIHLKIVDLRCGSTFWLSCGGGEVHSNNMSVQQPLKCLFVCLASPARHCLRRGFHASRILQARPSPKHASIKAEDMGLVKPSDKGRKRQARSPPNEELGVQPIDAQRLADPKTLNAYTEEEKAMLQKVYTPEQIASIEAGEAAVDPEDLKSQAVMREDTMGLKYFDDLSSIHPVVDKPVRAPEENYDPKMRFKTEDELVDDIANFFGADHPSEDPDQVQEEGEGPTLKDWLKFQENQRLTVGKEEAERNPRSYLAPKLPVMESLVKGVKSEDIEPAVQRLMRQTGYSNQEIRRFRTKVLVSHRVVNQTRMGKQQRQYFLCVAGNGKGLLGIGEGKSSEPEDARRMATLAAIRNIQPIPRYEERTIYGDVKGKVAGTEVELMTRTPGLSIEDRE